VGKGLGKGAYLSVRDGTTRKVMMPCLGGGRGGRQEEEQGSADEDAEWCTETPRAGYPDGAEG